MQLQHCDIWRGIDTLAASYGLSPSGLARMAGLDATAFNPSKRFNKDGRPRWPSTESLAAALNALGSDLVELAAIIESEKAQMPAQTPLIIETPDN